MEPQCKQIAVWGSCNYDVILVATTPTPQKMFLTILV